MPINFGLHYDDLILCLSLIIAFLVVLPLTIFLVNKKKNKHFGLCFLIFIILAIMISILFYNDFYSDLESYKHAKDVIEYIENNYNYPNDNNYEYPLNNGYILSLSTWDIMQILESMEQFKSLKPMSIIIFITLALSIVVNIFYIIKFYTMKHISKDLQKSLIDERMVETNKEKIEKIIVKPKWSTLKKDEKQPYIEKAIKELFIKQLEENELTRQEKALKQYSIDKNEFYIEDLSEEDKKQVLDSAKHKYENEEKFDNPTNNKQVIVIDNNKKFIKKNPLWFFPAFFLSCKIVSVPLGKCLSISGESNCNFAIHAPYFGKKWVFYTMFSWFTIAKTDVLKYKVLKQSNLIQQRFQIYLKNGRNLMVELNTRGAEILNRFLGIDLLEE